VRAIPRHLQVIIHHHPEKDILHMEANALCHLLISNKQH
jgi:hypothetical protein